MTRRSASPAPSRSSRPSSASSRARSARSEARTTPIRSATVLLPDFRRVPPGTDGAVSVAGTLAGLLGASLLAAAAAFMGWIGGAGVAVAVGAATAGTVVESLLGRDRAPWRISSGHVLNFVNTLVGAGTALLLARPGGAP